MSTILFRSKQTNKEAVTGNFQGHGSSEVDHTETIRAIKLTFKLCHLWFSEEHKTELNLVMSYGIIAKTKVVIGASQPDHHRLSRLWHRFIQQTHASESFFSCVTKAESMCTATKDMSNINEKKKGERGSDVRSICQCSINHTWRSLRNQTGKGHGFRKSMARFWQIRIESVPAATKRSSSCHRVSRQPGRASTLSWRRWPARIGNAFRRFIRGGSPWTASRARSLQLRSQAEGSELLFRGTCMLRLADSTRTSSAVTTFSGCESDHRCLSRSEAPCQGRWGASQAT